MRKTIVFALVMLVAGLAAAQGVPVPCTLTIVSGQSLSPAARLYPALSIRRTRPARGSLPK